MLTEKAGETLRLASEDARKLGHPTWDSEHILLALTTLGGERAVPGAAIRSHLDVTEPRVRGLIERHIPCAAERDEIYASHQIERVHLHARWIAAYLGRVRTDTDHLLLGVLWDEQPENKVLRDLGISFVDVYQEVTGGPPPEEVAPPKLVYISEDHLTTLLGTLPAVLPSGVSFSFACDDERAWFSTHSDIDLELYVRRALPRAAQ